MYKIEKVAIKKGYPFKDMKVGDSFWLSEFHLVGRKKGTNLHNSKHASALRKYKQTHSGTKFSVRVEFSEKGVKGLRFIRLE